MQQKPCEKLQPDRAGDTAGLQGHPCRTSNRRQGKGTGPPQCNGGRCIGAVAQQTGRAARTDTACTELKGKQQ